MGVWMSRKERERRKRRFFQGSGQRDSQGRTARDFLTQASGSGYDIDLKTGNIRVSRGPISDVYSGYYSRYDQASLPGTGAYKQVEAERQLLAEQMNRSMGGRPVGFFVQALEDGSTGLFWQGYDYRGRYSTKPFHLATSSKSNARLSDFMGPTAGTFAPGLREDVLRDRFYSFYKLVTGRDSILAPTEREQTAIDFRSQLREAGGIVSGHDWSSGEMEGGY